MFKASDALASTNSYTERLVRAYVDKICKDIESYSSQNETKFMFFNAEFSFIDRVVEILRNEGEYVVTINGDQMTISWDPNDKIQPKGTASDPAFPEGWDAARIARWERTAEERQKFGADPN